MKRLPPLPGLLMFRVAKFIGRKDFPAAIRALEECAARDPGDVGTLDLLAQCHRWAGANDKAIEVAEKALTLDPTDFSSLRLLSVILADRGEHNRAVEYVRRGVQHYPKEMAPLAPFVVTLGKIVMRVLRPRHRMAAEEFAPWERINSENREWFAWAKQYLAWFESSTGSDTSPLLH